MRTLRQELVRAAGLAGRKGRIKVALMLEMERCRLAFAVALASRTWGPHPPAPKRLVKVPRSLRAMFGPVVKEIHYAGRKRKDRRKHNRRWMPRQECECE